MNNAKHTPGPFFVLHESGIAQYHERFEDARTAMDAADKATDGNIVPYIVPASQAVAAPELLEALDDMLSRFADHEQYDETGEDTEVINAARAAIAKATGQQ